MREGAYIFADALWRTQRQRRLRPRSVWSAYKMFMHVSVFMIKCVAAGEICGHAVEHRCAGACHVRLPMHPPHGFIAGLHANDDVIFSQVLLSRFAP